MDHSQATQITAVEKYLLDELSPEERDRFEEHYFDCQECALDLQMTAAFMASAKKELQANSVLKPGTAGNGKAFFASLWPSALVWSALAASLLLIAYQNLVVFPRYATEIAQLRAPEILPAISLVRDNSRGGRIPTATVDASRPFLLQLDLPTQDRFSSYSCLLYTPSGSLALRVEVSAQSAKDTVSVRVPSANRQPGKYTFAVQGHMDQGAAPVDLGHYEFVLQGRE